MISSKHISEMLNHWLSSKPNAYVGSNYGPDIESLFLKSLSSNTADRFIEKMLSDLPILKKIPSDQFKVFSSSSGFEKQQIILQIGDVKISLNTVLDAQKALNNRD